MEVCEMVAAKVKYDMTVSTDVFEHAMGKVEAYKKMIRFIVHKKKEDTDENQIIDEFRTECETKSTEEISDPWPYIVKRLKSGQEEYLKMVNSITSIIENA
jgi:hypothetical protein